MMSCNHGKVMKDFKNHAVMQHGAELLLRSMAAILQTHATCSRPKKSWIVASYLIPMSFSSIFTFLTGSVSELKLKVSTLTRHFIV